MSFNNKKKGGQSGSELLALVRQDVSGLTDDDLDRLVLETHLESGRRRKIPLPSPATFKRWGAAGALMLVAFFILFKAETSAVGNGNESGTSTDKNTVMAPDGQKGAWLDGDDQVDKMKKERTEADKMQDSLSQKMNGEDDAAKTAEGEEPAAKDPAVDTDGPAAVEEPAATEAPAAEVAAGPAVSLADLPLKADDAAKEEALKTGRRPMIKYQYNLRSKSKDDAQVKKELAETWGSWTYADPKATDRPKDDFAGGFPNRDIPWDQFPANAWQTDQEHLKKFLPEAKALVERAMEGMLAEFGLSKFELPDQNFTARMDMSPFKQEVLNLTNGDPWKTGKAQVGERLGGWMTPRFHEGLVRRLMHAVITQDTFTSVMGGHSAAAGHGNLFQQSYTLQFHKVMEPIFARLGVKLRSHNIAFGGLGTVQTSLASGDLMGKEIDLLVWDSGMTEKSGPAYDLFVRQQYLSANRIPVLLGGMGATLENLDRSIDAEVANPGAGIDAFPQVQTPVEADKTIWAARCLNYAAGVKDYCRSIEYNGTCWMDRDDYTPETAQAAEPSGRAGWHPGFRFHAVVGRNQGMMLLRALYQGFEMWESSPDLKLPVEAWHVKDHYDHIRKKMAEAPDEDKECLNYEQLQPKEIICSTPLSGVSEMNPRVNPRENAIRNIMKPAADGYLPLPEESVYNPPDLFNPRLEPPDDEFDYLTVVENGIDFPEFASYDNAPMTTGYLETKNKLIPLGVEGIEPGRGWSLDAPANPDGCDGSYDGFCNRGKNQNCLLYGHNDHRGGLWFDSFSGWGVFTVPNVKKGLILTRIEWWYGNVNSRTDGWTTENNVTERRLNNDIIQMGGTNLVGPSERNISTLNSDDYMWIDESPNSTLTKKRRLGNPQLPKEQMGRELKGAGVCDAVKFEIAFNGKIRSFTKDEYNAYTKVFQRVVPIITILEEEGFMNGETVDIEFALRLTGCGKNNVFSLSNIYWA